MGLRATRVAKKISQAELGRMLGIDPSIVRHVEAGRLSPYPKFRRGASKALGVDESILFPVVDAEAGMRYAEKLSKILRRFDCQCQRIEDGAFSPVQRSKLALSAVNQFRNELRLALDEFRTASVNLTNGGA